MTLTDFRPRWRVGLRLPCRTSVAPPLVVDVLSGVPMGMCSPCRHACSAGAFALHFARHPLWLLRCMVLHTCAPVHAHFGVHPHVQIVCPERTQPAASRAFADGLAASSAVPPGRRCQERQRGAKVEGKIKGRGTLLREKAVCTWGWRGTRWLRHRAAWIANALSALSQARASHAWLRQPWMGVAHEPQR